MPDGEKQRCSLKINLIRNTQRDRCPLCIFQANSISKICGSSGMLNGVNGACCTLAILPSSLRDRSLLASTCRFASRLGGPRTMILDGMLRTQRRVSPHRFLLPLYPSCLVILRHRCAKYCIKCRDTPSRAWKSANIRRAFRLINTSIETCARIKNFNILFMKVNLAIVLK